jgi:hypothetical protein
MSKKNLKKYYKIFSSDSLESLESKISDHLSKGYDPIGGLTINNGVFYQALYIEAVALIDFNYIIEIARSGEKLKAVKMYKEMMGVDLLTAKDWVDSNC